jgi:hypothetical protein
VEFTGGRLVEYATSQPVSVDAARRAVASARLPRAVVNESGDGNVAVRSGGFDDDSEQRVRDALVVAGAGSVERLRDEKAPAASSPDANAVFAALRASPEGLIASGRRCRLTG